MKIEYFEAFFVGVFLLSIISVGLSGISMLYQLLYCIFIDNIYVNDINKPWCLFVSSFPIFLIFLLFFEIYGDD